MARAFTEEQKAKIRERLLEAALELFHRQGTKSLSISALTGRVGIAQGSFYRFWKDKESLIIDLMAYRSTQKLAQIEKGFSHSLSDPKKFLVDVIYHYAIDLVKKIRCQPVYREAFGIFVNQSPDKAGRVSDLYGKFLSDLIEYWQEHAAVIRADRTGLLNVFAGCLVLCVNYVQFDENCFEEVLRLYIESTVSRYIEV